MWASYTRDALTTVDGAHVSSATNKGVTHVRFCGMSICIFSLKLVAFCCVWVNNMVCILLAGSTTEVTNPLTQKQNCKFSRLWISRKTIIKFLFPVAAVAATPRRSV